MKDLGSFIEYEFPVYTGLYDSIPKQDIIALNSCRAAIYHAVRCYGVSKVWLATYQCDEVRDFLSKKGIEILYYSMDEDFNPIFPQETNDSDTAIVLSNYFGILGDRHFLPLIQRFRNVIIDNAQAYFYHPLPGCLNCYSPRKFLAAPDGAYVIGKDVNRFSYEQGLSSDTSQFLFMRQEYGCDMHIYANKKQNDYRLHDEDVLLMSPLTDAMIHAADLNRIIEIRKENFRYARKLFDPMNQWSLSRFTDEDSIPMGYPLMVDFEIIPAFHEAHIYQPRYWEYILDEAKPDCLDYKIAKYMALLCIDQRYGKEDIDRQYEIITQISQAKAGGKL